MATSTKQLAANRNNALKSTGPRTEEGKRQTSLNALSHGLTAKSYLLPFEEEAEFNALVENLYHTLMPQNVIEETFAQNIALAAWKIRRIEKAEQAAFSIAIKQIVSQEGTGDPQERQILSQAVYLTHPDSEKFHRYATAIKNDFFKAVKNFQIYRITQKHLDDYKVTQ
jgi:hypothetical protein